MRMCLWLFSRSLQTSLHPAEDHPQTALTGLTLQESKNPKNLTSTLTLTITSVVEGF